MEGKIEKAQRSDLPEILCVQKAAFAPIAVLLNRTGLQPMMQTLAEIQSEYDRWFFFKCTIEGRIIGSVRAHLDDENICRIFKLVVLPEYQSAGIGKALMQAVHERFKGCDKFELFTGKDISQIVHFYRKLGYTQTITKTMDGVEMVFMERNNRCLDS